MSGVSWTNKDEGLVLEQPKQNRLKFVVAGVVLVAAIVYLVVNAMSGNTQLYKTVGE